MNFNNINKVSTLLKCISHEQRLKIVCILIDNERTVNELVEDIGISQSQMSQFLKQLKDIDIVDSKKSILNGVANKIYFIKDKKIKNIIKALKNNYC